jgi:hypothetical protein
MRPTIDAKPSASSGAPEEGVRQIVVAAILQLLTAIGVVTVGIWLANIFPQAQVRDFSWPSFFLVLVAGAGIGAIVVLNVLKRGLNRRVAESLARIDASVNKFRA